MAGNCYALQGFSTSDANTMKAGQGQRLVRAYAEGRASSSATSPHTSGSPEDTVWSYGYSNRATLTATYRIECTT